MVELKFINNGVASRQGDVIFLNRQLIFHPKLLSAIISHEKEHTPTYSLKDIIIDFRIRELDGMKREYWSFVLKNPSSWSEFSPVWKMGDKIVLNPSLLMFYGLAIAIVGGLLWILA